MRIAALVVVAGCTVPPPFQTFETASTLPKGGVQLMVAGGGGGGEGLDGCCGGGAARVRLGIGGDQELSLDGNMIFSRYDVIGGLRAGYKIAPWTHVALVGGAGGVLYDNYQTVGGDLGVIVSARDADDVWIPYTALRVSAAIPAKGDRYDAGGVSETFTIPLGVSRRLIEHWQLMAEIGGVGAVSELRKTYDMMIHTQTNLGLYGGLAIGWQP
jgi:hypothetical protein